MARKTGAVAFLRSVEGGAREIVWRPAITAKGAERTIGVAGSKRLPVSVAISDDGQTVFFLRALTVSGVAIDTFGTWHVESELPMEDESWLPDNSEFPDVEPTGGDIAVSQGGERVAHLGVRAGGGSSTAVVCVRSPGTRTGMVWPLETKPEYGGIRWVHLSWNDDGSALFLQGEVPGKAETVVFRLSEKGLKKVAVLGGTSRGFLRRNSALAQELPVTSGAIKVFGLWDEGTLTGLAGTGTVLVDRDPEGAIRGVVESPSGVLLLWRTGRACAELRMIEKVK